jgi:hypothetical protein
MMAEDFETKIGSRLVVASTTTSSLKSDPLASRVKAVLRRKNMKDYSLFENVKELRGDITYRFMSNNKRWMVFQEKDYAFVFKCTIGKKRESNRALYNRVESLLSE